MSDDPGKNVDENIKYSFPFRLLRHVIGKKNTRVLNSDHPTGSNIVFVVMKAYTRVCVCVCRFNVTRTGEGRDTSK